MKSLVVFGFILFSQPPEKLNGSTVRVQLLDITYTDEAAKVIAEKIIVPKQFGLNEHAPLEYSLHSDHINKDHRYEIWVHVDVDGSQDVSPGDYLTTQSYPVGTDSDEVNLDVYVSKI